MAPFTAHQGLIAPNLTPFNDDLSLATDLYVAHARALLEGPCAALAPFGTTGEALSVAPAERIEALKALIGAGIDARRLIPGTGLTSLPETVALSRKCLDMGCAAVMVLPPFYFKPVSDDGLFAYFAALVQRLGPDARIVLYHIPQVSGVGFPVPLVARLRQAFPDQIVGIKDSSGKLDNTLALLDIEGLTVWPGSELPVLETSARGAPGCISATANLNGAAIAEVLELLREGRREEAAAKHEAVKAVRLTFQDYAPIPAQKRLLAMVTGEARWANLRPPLMPVSEEKGEELLKALGPEFRARLEDFARSEMRG
ncbi:MAG: dihydrodipicolinate synthase family protein [Alphaproteobacteria bacterium]|nr:MAG: dihydrodipicolinate synthase family protein [Alphaproteobacteria bacterium]